MRQTVRITAPIIGGIGGFVVTAIVLVLQKSPSQQGQAAQVQLAAGLLALSLSGCLVGAFSLASLAGESKQTVNLQAAAMYMAVGPTIAIVAILAAFHVLAKLYIPQASDLFAAMAAMVGIAGVVYNSTGIIDEWDTSPGSSRWVRSRHHAEAWVTYLVAAGSVPVVAGGVLLAMGFTLHPSSGAVTWHMLTGMAIAVGGGVMGLFRSLHSVSGNDPGIERWEAIGLQLVMGLYIAALIVILPR
ncbi:MAG TPA: hypothetical protein VFJ61_10930 [Solirubrobacterales bacterium]|nr:hypothetical protein [Solirubrobacterales bacterium]